jgi:hypothetical protein
VGDPNHITPSTEKKRRKSRAQLPALVLVFFGFSQHRTEAIPDAWIRDLTHRVARQACQDINRVSPLTPSSLVAKALLACEGRALSDQDLNTYIGVTVDVWAKAYGMEIKTSCASLEEDLARIPFLNRCRRRGERRTHNVSPVIQNLRRADRGRQQKVFLPPLNELRSTYNRNNVIHSFVIPDFLARQRYGPYQPGPRRDPGALQRDGRRHIRDLCKRPEKFLIVNTQDRYPSCRESLDNGSAATPLPRDPHSVFSSHSWQI